MAVNFIVSVNGTGVMSYDRRHSEKCLVTRYESGKKRYFHNVLEAKMVLPNGLTLSMATEWIENEGFNEQKNNGYELEHKYSEVSLRASKNYYQSMQIAAIINQLLVKGEKLKRYFGRKITIKHLWKNLLAFMLYGEVDENHIENLLSHRVQIQLE